MSKSKGGGYVVSRSPTGERGVFTSVKANGRTTKVMNADVYASASRAANTVIRSAISGRFVTSAAVDRHPKTTVAESFRTKRK